jgi:hypothetical protein
MTDDEAPPSPADSLRMIQTEQASAVRMIRPDPRLLFWPWGVAWLIGFGLLFLRFGPDDRVTVAMPDWLPLTVLYVLMGIAFVVTGWAGARVNRHIAGTSQRQGLYYGLAWFAAYFTVGVAAGRVSDLLPADEVGLLWAGLSIGVVGVLYIAGAAIWQSRDMFLLGAWLTVTNVIGVIVGPGWHSLIAAIAGGGGLLVAGFIQWLGLRREA